MPQPPLKVAWISYFPVEWLPQLPDTLRGWPRGHPASWLRVLLEEVKGSPETKLHVLTLQKSYPGGFMFEWEGVTFHCLRASMKLRVFSLFWLDALVIRKCLRQVRPDLVHAWGSERGAALVASRLHYPYLVTMQGLLEWYLSQVDLGWFARLEARCERVALRRASVVTTESSFGVRWLGEHYPHLKVRQVEHAPSWIFHRLERAPQLTPVQFLFVGPMCHLKGTDLLLRALDQIRAEVVFRLVIIGTGSAEFVQQMKRTTSSALWDRITVRHGLTPAEVAQELARATMMLFPTRADTSPNSVKEAVVAGLPVVASAVGGIVDYVRPERNGFTFPAGDLDEFVRAIRAALAHPLFGKGQVDSATHQQMREYLSPKVMAEKFVAAYRHVVQRGSAGRR